MTEGKGYFENGFDGADGRHGVLTNLDTGQWLTGTQVRAGTRTVTFKIDSATAYGRDDGTKFMVDEWKFTPEPVKVPTTNGSMVSWEDTEQRRTVAVLVAGRWLDVSNGSMVSLSVRAHSVDGTLLVMSDYVGVVYTTE